MQNKFIKSDRLVILSIRCRRWKPPGEASWTVTDALW